MRLNQDFYQQHVVSVAKELLGKKLIFKGTVGIITETEAYRGADDEASHAYKGMTPRSKIMFAAPGRSYVYMIYGMYYCLNIVCESSGQAAAVLLRGLQFPKIHCNGPGKLCRHLGITTEHNNKNLLRCKEIYVAEGLANPAFQQTPCIGIRKAKDKLWRFVLKDPITDFTSIVGL